MFCFFIEDMDKVDTCNASGENTEDTDECEGKNILYIWQ